MALLGMLHVRLSASSEPSPFRLSPFIHLLLLFGQRDVQFMRGDSLAVASRPAPVGSRRGRVRPEITSRLAVRGRRL